jgi:hypothetical protein
MDDDFFDEDEESNENIDVKDDIYNYKGYFVENEQDEEEKKFYEFGAHFSYEQLCQRLEIISKERKQKQTELEEKLNKKEKEKETKKEPPPNKDIKNNDNIKKLLSIYQQKGKSRNRNDIEKGLTYMPHLNKKIFNNLSDNENKGNILLKSTSNQNNTKIKNKDKNILKINLDIKDNKNNLFNLNNNNITTKSKGRIKNNKKTNKNIKLSQKQIKIKRRNDSKYLNGNESTNSNKTVNIYLFNKSKLMDKINSKNVTHDTAYLSRVKNNLVNKLKSIQHSKEVLRKQILRTGNIEERLNKKLKMNGIFSKFKNRNIKFGKFKQLDGKNTENCSSSKNISIKPPNHQKIISTKTSVSFVHNQVKKYIYNIKNKMNNNFNNHFNTLNSHIKSLKDNNIKNKDISFKKSKNKISQLKISSNNKSKTLLLDKKGSKAPFRQKKINLEVIDKILIKKRKNNISRNIISLFNNASQNSTNKNFNSVNNALNGVKNNKINDDRAKLSFSSNYSNLTQQLKTYKSNKLKVRGSIPNQISISTASLKNYFKPKIQKKKNIELNANKSKKIEINKKKINKIDVKDKLKNNIYMKSEKKNVSGAKVQKEAKSNKKKLGRNKQSINRYGNKFNNYNNNKFIDKKNNTLLISHPPHMLFGDIDKNHFETSKNNNNNINYSNKVNNGINHKSINLCSIRSLDFKEVNSHKKINNI